MSYVSKFLEYLWIGTQSIGNNERVNSYTHCGD